MMVDLVCVAVAAVIIVSDLVEGRVWEDLNLHPQHYPFFFNTNPGVADECHQDPNCPYKVHLDRDACWGYESACPPGEAYSQPSCPGDARGWVNTKKEQRETFYKQADFGYIKKRRSELEVYCQPEQEVDSSLECSDHLRFCRGKNLWLDLRHLTERSDPVLYHTDVLMKGQIGGHCRVDEELLKKNTDMISFLQSWGPEMRHFQRIDKPVARQSEQCDIWVEKPAYVMKLDAIGNMYHHFCDFFNLYASLHVNNSDERAFFNDTQVLVWTTYQYRTNFAPAFTAFTENPIWNLKDVSGKRVCFREVMFPLLPRMIFGLYYNTPLIWGCEESGLFHAFSRHMLHRLGVFGREGIVDDRIHITILSRQTKYRQILNEGELTQALQKNENYVVHRAVYSHQVDLQYQLRQDQWTDIFVGMHGSGLTHLLFLPDWAVVFEIYNCGDPNCYQDLARLRGIKYMTWEDSSKFTPQDEGYHPQLKGAHEKFTNYTFDVAEFQRLIEKAVKYVKGHQGWQNLQAKTQSTPGHQELSIYFCILFTSSFQILYFCFALLPTLTWPLSFYHPTGRVLPVVMWALLQKLVLLQPQTLPFNSSIPSILLFPPCLLSDLSITTSLVLLYL